MMAPRSSCRRVCRYIDALETAAKGIQLGIDEHTITGDNALNLLMAIADQLKRESRSLSVLLNQS
ncbi:hypothetical protein QCD60_15705 [Pokkaliibacter sp. MBI-7]|uniref:hypothetical protein n=1 Tax=Pokkaliibacter sp. MBI-7 TaxID=3040600 RepID=UPI00244CA006|nr:hypothetical protein [Pokkaliibacter sp. MBI-7]MDH2434012.1 hypothetical protein [Pokkaliibacter sp. MBI-7]